MSSPPIKNIYYMLAYTFRDLQIEDYKEVSAEEFDNVLDLLGRIIVGRLNRLIKQGFFRDYIRKSETSSSIRGKINLTESIKTLSLRKKQLNFSYNEYSINNYLNQIIKTSLLLFIKSDINETTENNIRRILLYFSDVDTLDPRFIDWEIRYYRNNQDYEIIINFCRLAIEGLLQTEEDGTLKLLHFSDKFMYSLYEDFIYNYYMEQSQDNPKYKEYITVRRDKLTWPLNHPEDNHKKYLPIMRTDIVLKSKKGDNKFLIIDAKYYKKIFRKYKGKESISSGNLYQIFTYVKSKEFEHKQKNEKHEISGMLLYAGTDEINQPDEMYVIDGNKILVKTLDLNQDFEGIENQLYKIAKCFWEGEY